MRIGEVRNFSEIRCAVRAPVLGRAAPTPIAALTAEHRRHELLEFFVLYRVGTLESPFTTSSAPPPNEQCADEQTHQSLNSTIDGCAGDCSNGVHVQIGHIAECQTAADVATRQHKRHWRVCALTPFGNESFAGLE